VTRLHALKHIRLQLAAGGNEDEEAGYRFGAHTFSTGEYVSISDHGGEPHIFQVTAVEPLA
jgi:hypothetical protein